MADDFIFYFGAPNDTEGNLSSISRSRADKIVEISNRNKDAKIILTGGFGNHFNTAKMPHYYYVEEYLKENGVNVDRIIARLTTNNTVDDVRLIAEFCLKNKVVKPVLVTSEFHAVRSQLLFREFFDRPFKVETSTTDCTTEEFVNLVEHEFYSIKKLLNDQEAGRSPRASIPDQR
jgi:uncharacterized SAM-binding protein YcdF (DUF218 family)